MSDGIYVALSGAVARADELDAVANNLANANTTAYRPQRASFSSVLATRTAAYQPQPGFLAQEARFPVDRYHAVEQNAPARFTQGGILETGAELDLALEGDGLFVLDAGGRTVYTRDGHFLKDGEGFLTAADGARVQGQKGPIQLPVGRVVVESDGLIRVEGRAVERLMLVNFDATAELKREGANRYSSASQPRPAFARVHQGALEGAAVSVMTEMLRLIEVHRSFDALQEAIRTYRDLDSQINTASRPG